MTTAEKIDSAISNKYFTLFKEGLFYKCYNEDAMVFVKNVKEYKVSGKFIKSVGADEIVYLLTIYDKSDKDTLTIKELKELLAEIQ